MALLPSTARRFRSPRARDKQRRVTHAKGTRRYMRDEAFTLRGVICALQSQKRIKDGTGAIKLTFWGMVCLQCLFLTVTDNAALLPRAVPKIQLIQRTSDRVRYVSPRPIRPPVCLVGESLNCTTDRDLKPHCVSSPTSELCPCVRKAEGGVAYYKYSDKIENGFN